MKKKLLLTLVMATVFALTLTVVAFAGVVHDESNVDYSEQVTLSDGTVLPLFDENKEALVWYISGTNEEGKNVYSSVRTDNGTRVKWYTESWGEVTAAELYEEDGTTRIANDKIVVVNMMDDDVVTNYGPGVTNPNHSGKHITGFKYIFRGWKGIEYVYLRLDVDGIYRESFSNCPKLRYVNIEDLVYLKRLGDSQNFSNCVEFFKGQILDLSKTALERIDGGSSFNNVHFTGIKLPSTIKVISSGTFATTSFKSFAWPTTVSTIESSMFQSNSSLETIYLSNSLTGTIGDNAFYNCTSLNTIYYVGSLEELSTLLSRTSKTNNDPFWAVVGENNANVISYADYKKLEDKSGKYVVYDYSWCEAYNEGKHEVVGANPCVGTCSVCQNDVVSHIEGQFTTVKVEYADFSKSGLKITTCNNDGCTYKETITVPAIFICLGYSAPEDGRGGIAIGFTVNNVAIAEYEKVTGKTLKYGVFAVLQSRLGDNDIFGKDGTQAEGSIIAEISSYKFASFELKITGFETNEHKALKLAMGAYAAVTDGETTEYSYMQGGEPNENEKYCFVSYNDIVGTPSTDEEVTQ